jgi:hypothetical protein
MSGRPNKGLHQPKRARRMSSDGWRRLCAFRSSLSAFGGPGGYLNGLRDLLARSPD